MWACCLCFFLLPAIYVSLFRGLPLLSSCLPSVFVRLHSQGALGDYIPEPHGTFITRSFLPPLFYLDCTQYFDKKAQGYHLTRGPYPFITTSSIHGTRTLDSQCGRGIHRPISHVLPTDSSHLGYSDHECMDAQFGHYSHVFSGPLRILEFPNSDDFHSLIQ